jgi:hypothetical protein
VDSADSRDGSLQGRGSAVAAWSLGEEIFVGHVRLIRSGVFDESFDRGRGRRERFETGVPAEADEAAPIAVIGALSVGCERFQPPEMDGVQELEQPGGSKE